MTHSLCITRCATLLAVLCLWSSCFQGARASFSLVVVNDNPANAHATVQVVAQQFGDRPGRPSVDVAIPFTLPSAAGTCNGTLALTGAFRVVAQQGPAAPSSVVFTLGQGAAPPTALGPTTTRITWSINATSSGFSAALAAGGNATSTFTFALSLRVTPLSVLPAGQCYWISAHAVMPDGNGTQLNRFYWRALAASQPPSALGASLRDLANVLGRNWTAWTTLGVVENALFPPAVVASSLPRLAATFNVSGCTGAAVPAPASVPVPRAAQPTTPSPVTLATTATVVPIPSAPPTMSGPSPLAVAVDGTPSSSDSPSGATPSVDDSRINNNNSNGSPVFSSLVIGIIIASSALVFGGIVFLVIWLVRRYRRLARIKSGALGAKEYMNLHNSEYGAQPMMSGGVIPLAGVGTSRETSSNATGAHPATDTGETATERTSLSRSSILPVPSLALRDSNIVPLDASTGRHSAPNSARSEHMMDDDDEAQVPNLTSSSRRGSIGSASAHKRPKKRARAASVRAVAKEDDADASDSS